MRQSRTSGSVGASARWLAELPDRFPYCRFFSLRSLSCAALFWINPRGPGFLAVRCRMIAGICPRK